MNEAPTQEAPVEPGVASPPAPAAAAEPHIPYEGRRPSGWDFVQPRDAARLGQQILDPYEQARWSLAVLLAGGLPSIWAKAGIVKSILLDLFELTPGANVLIIGEGLEDSGMPDQVRHAVEPDGNVTCVDFIDEVRDRASRGTSLAWRWSYTDAEAADSFDLVFVQQGLPHADDWTVVGPELVRVLKPGRPIVFCEIASGAKMVARIRADVHIESAFDRLFAHRPWPHYTELPHYPPEVLTRELEGVIARPHSFEWRGFELTWGYKPSSSDEHAVDERAGKETS
jgi:SAM-dependent methyltransferase